LDSFNGKMMRKIFLVPPLIQLRKLNSLLEKFQIGESFNGRHSSAKILSIKNKNSEIIPLVQALNLHHYGLVR
jgi:hypothetical protein